MSLHESCGVFGIYAPGEDVARLTYFALHALQHRGQESAGIASGDGQSIRLHADMGLVAQVFDEETLERLAGSIAIGHNRYSTTGSSCVINAQPIVGPSALGEVALGHNGNLTNAAYLRAELEGQGYVFRTSSDSEVIAHLLASAPGKTMVENVRFAMARLQGAYSLVIMTKDQLLGVRDPLGVRPLCFGTLNGSWVIASESCALDQLGIQVSREIVPGEIVLIDESGFHSFPPANPSAERALCIFEYIYFARPDSTIGGRRLYPARLAMGAGLSREHPVDADLVIGVPDSATAAAVGYSQASGVPFGEGLLKSRYVGRTFIQPDQRLRDVGVRLKFNPIPEVLSGKRVVVVDDSIVRGTTTPRIVALLRKAGAREVHLRICAPPIRYPCIFGIDMATRRELIAATRSIPEICQWIGADSLGYLSLDGLIEAVGLPRENFCLACFTGDYPVPVQLEMDKLALERWDDRTTG
ncbi:amidophosphoribosyltransferase [Dehalococcoidia bacterium]|nr:amidophosphoribosyltransferase [Dehalococcoidia bacterium]MCL0104185.1 amidophosphoribosyltransferase [Dehalococcoidia bacterium]